MTGGVEQQERTLEKLYQLLRGRTEDHCSPARHPVRREYNHFDLFSFDDGQDISNNIIPNRARESGNDVESQEIAWCVSLIPQRSPAVGGDDGLKPIGIKIVVGLKCGLAASIRNFLLTKIDLLSHDPL
jgi:hypothetical protein